nr:sigma factor [Aeromicrobium camelliae]
MTADEVIEESWREHRPRLLALLTARFERVDLAEDALAEAFAKAARLWGTDGVPASPVAWLHRVAQREVIDRLRSEASAHRAAARIAEDLTHRAEAGEPRLEAVPDDMLRLVFLACHPALPPHAQTALALRWVLAVPTTEIARLFAVAPAAMSARLTRARQRAAAEPTRSSCPPGPRSTTAWRESSAPLTCSSRPGMPRPRAIWRYVRRSAPRRSGSSPSSTTSRPGVPTCRRCDHSWNCSTRGGTHGRTRRGPRAARRTRPSALAAR